MAKQQKKSKSGSSRKIGQNKDKCAAYAGLHRREKNQERRIKRHLKDHPADNTAKGALKKVWG